MKLIIGRSIYLTVNQLFRCRRFNESPTRRPLSSSYPRKRQVTYPQFSKVIIRFRLQVMIIEGTIKLQQLISQFQNHRIAFSRSRPSLVRVTHYRKMKSIGYLL